MSMLTDNKDLTPKAWVGCLACYNSGRLVGEWLELTDAVNATPEDIHGQETSHEELWCMDFVNMPQSFQECSPSDLEDWADALDYLGEDQFEIFCMAYSDGIVDDPTRFEDHFVGAYADIDEFLEEEIENFCDCYDVHERVRPYIDGSQFLRDLELGGDISIIVDREGYSYVFRNF